MGLDRTYHAHRFIFSFTFQFFVCSVWWTKLATRQPFYCTLNTQYRIISYRRIVLDASLAVSPWEVCLCVDTDQYLSPLDMAVQNKHGHLPHIFNIQGGSN